MIKNLDYLFKMKNVAVIGASTSPNVGTIVYENFLDKKFKGKVFPVNPKYKKIKGKKCYSSVLDIKEKIDHVVIAVPAKVCGFVLRECVEKKIKTVTILAGGFSEVGNSALEDNLKKIIKGSETRIVGPNCVGTYDSFTFADSIFLPRDKLTRPKKGNISVISQSGAVGSILLDYMASQNLGVSKFISYGNAADVNETDLIEYLSKDKLTDVIVCYIEGVRDGKNFIRICKNCKKPIIILKGGTSEKTARAVSSHTGSMAGSGEVYSGIFKQAGIIQASNWQELFDIAKAYTQPVPKGKKMIVITDGGGFGILATDSAFNNDIDMPLLSKKTLSKIKGLKFPEYCVLSNPLDLNGDVTSERLSKAMDIVMKENEFDFIFLIALLQVPNLGEKAVNEIIRLNAKYKKVPLYVVSAGSGYARDLANKMLEKGIPVYETPEQGVKAISKIIK